MWGSPIRPRNARGWYYRLLDICRDQGVEAYYPARLAQASGQIIRGDNWFMADFLHVTGDTYLHWSPPSQLVGSCTITVANSISRIRVDTYRRGIDYDAMLGLRYVFGDNQPFHLLYGSVNRDRKIVDLRDGTVWHRDDTALNSVLWTDLAYAWIYEFPPAA